MADVSDLYDETDDGVVLHVHVQPGAGRSAVVGRHGDALKVRVAAPPVEGRANEATLALLAEALGVAASDVELTSGPTSRSKRFRLRGLDATEIDKRLRVALEGAKAPEGGQTGRRSTAR
ncbi:MAG: DUF167 family protein [Actinomycetota bacterium]|nr:DUF167 family protein [Actinomycetota bacterium]